VRCLPIVDDATTEAIAVVPARALGGLLVTRVLDQLAVTRGLPQVLRTDDGLDAERLYRIVQRRLHDECPNEDWFTSLAHARVVIETWRRECNEERRRRGSVG
jgi:putative transposase